MTDSIPHTQHQPAVKVAGRRLSISTKHKTHPSEERTSSEEKEPESSDYPRPSPTTGDPEVHHDHTHNHYEEEGPHKKDKKQNSEKKVQEYAYWKSEATRPTRDVNVPQKGQNTRISQPAGKGFNV